MADYFALVPAAGSGQRLPGTQPKQYLPVAHRALMFHALSTLCACPQINKVFVVLAPEDACWQESFVRNTSRGFRHAQKLEVLWCGGEQRADSVRLGLVAMANVLSDDDWVLVHDAARPGLPQENLQEMIEALSDDDIGGILAMPVVDTLKKEDGAGRIAATVDRQGLWQAQTPQMFRYRKLYEALCAYPEVTDEASALEEAGYAPRLIRGSVRNFKVTWPDDLRMAEALLSTHRPAKETP
jgi:2-C-methyl-D-erythritol 4-phosphate cytidylyltransferase